jgi:tetratricopeptide (TPR) repeat protein
MRSDEFDPRRWRARLAELRDSREFAAAIERQLSAISPLTPGTDTDTLVRSMAPEAYRLAAAWQMLRGRHEEAVRLAGEALALYAPMRSRFPTMSAHTLAEMAEYEFRGDPRRAGEAAGRLEEAIRSLPEIQAQQREAIARPYREAGALYAMAAGDVPRARAMFDGSGESAPTDAELAQRLAEFAGAMLRVESVPLEVAAGWLDTVLGLDRANFTGWSWVAWCVAKRGDFATLEQVFAQARASGVTAEQIERMRRSLAAVFPPPTPTTTAPAESPGQR